MSRVRAFARLLIVLAAAVPVAAAAQTADVPVSILAHAIARGDVVAASDFDQALRPAATARGCLTADEAAGREAVRALPAGTIVRAGDLIAPRLVRRGEAVTLSLQGRGFAITTAARALAAGGMGDVVRVVASSTNHSVDGVVTGAGSVRVAAQ